MKKVLTTGVAAAIAMLAVNMLIVNPIFMKLYPEFQAIYENTLIFRSMDDPLMMLFFAYPIFLAFAFAWVWDRSKQLFTGSFWTNGFHFSIVYFLIAGLPAFLINWGSFNLPVMMIVSWTLMTYVNGLVAGLVLAKMNPPRAASTVVME